jgi:ribosomal protein S18 acetylase RimI-like enzyme
MERRKTALAVSRLLLRISAAAALLAGLRPIAAADRRAGRAATELGASKLQRATLWSSGLASATAADPSMTVRKLEGSDLERIREIDREAFSTEEQYEDEVYARMPRSGQSVVALDGDCLVVGYAFVQVDTYMRVRSIAVKPNYRRKGYGEAMLRAVVSRSDRDVDLLVDEWNVPAMELYRKLGFRLAEIDPAVPGRLRMVLKSS